MSKDKEIPYVGQVERIGRDSSDFIFKTTCDCIGMDHDMTINLEYDPDVEAVTLFFWHKLNWTSYWGSWDWEPHWYRGWLDRIQALPKGKKRDRQFFWYFKIDRIFWPIRLYRAFVKKIRATRDIWFKGRIEITSEFIFRGHDQVNAVGNAILESAKRLEEKNLGDKDNNE